MTRGGARRKQQERAAAAAAINALITRAPPQLVRGTPSYPPPWPYASETRGGHAGFRQRSHAAKPSLRHYVTRQATRSPQPPPVTSSQAVPSGPRRHSLAPALKGLAQQVLDGQVHVRVLLGGRRVPAVGFRREGRPGSGGGEKEERRGGGSGVDELSNRYGGPSRAGLGAWINRDGAFLLYGVLFVRCPLPWPTIHIAASISPSRVPIPHVLVGSVLPRSRSIEPHGFQGEREGGGALVCCTAPCNVLSPSSTVSATSNRGHQRINSTRDESQRHPPNRLRFYRRDGMSRSDDDRRTFAIEQPTEER